VTPSLLALVLAASPLVCPPGAIVAGRPPPFGNAEWCEGPGPGGQPRRQGPARDWYDAERIHVESTWRDGQLDGPWVELHRDGQKAAEGNYRAGERQGVWRFWSESGVLQEEVSFDAGRRHGKFRQWFPDGKRRIEGTFCFGTQCGRWITWGPDGQELGTITYEEIRGKP
jgi:antitoxin component YwqK of YwqJK toxin-antitoxin module